MSATGKLQLVGSIGLPDVETVFAMLSKTLGNLASRYPDGECGRRSRWILWQQELFSSNPGLEVGETLEIIFGGEQRTFEKYRIKPGTSAGEFSTGSLGYAEEAVRSYDIFKIMLAKGIIPPGTRFQVSLPTPVAVSTQYIVAPDQALVAEDYESCLGREIESMLTEIPAEQLAIQWDVCQEILAADGAWPVFYDDPVAGAVERLRRLASLVPASSQLGFHFCYGDPGHKHIKEPEDLGTCVQFANGLCEQPEHKVDWLHMPVPRERNDPGYVEPLRQLSIPRETELFLGLIHLTDGAEGAKRRIGSARQVITDFGTATECGFGRRPTESIPDLLKLHVEVAKMQAKTV